MLGVTAEASRSLRRGDSQRVFSRVFAQSFQMDRLEQTGQFAGFIAWTCLIRPCPDFPQHQPAHFLRSGDALA